MKTKSLVLFGVLIIALAAMAVPVMAYTTGSGGTAGGTQDVNVSLSMNNASVNFGSFAVGTNTISPSHYSAGGFPELVVYSNEDTWVGIIGTHNVMTSTDAPTPFILGNAMTIATSSATGDSGGLTLHPGAVPLTTTGPGADFIQGGTMNRANVSIALSQIVIPTDKASTTYSQGITVTYNTGI